MHVLIAGCGWLGSAVAARLLARGDRVTGVRSSPGSAQALRALGMEALELDLADPRAALALPMDVEGVLALQSAKGDREEDYRRAYLDVNHTLLGWSRRLPLKAFVYTGSTGVFGQRNGAEVSETTPPMPVTATGRVLLAAERRVLQAVGQGLPARLVRLSGLYGPGRTSVIERVRTGRLALGPGDEAWLNWCHQDDAAETVLAAFDRGWTGAVYHATDAAPMRRREVVAFVAHRLGIELPRSSTPYEGAHRRIRGEWTRRELGLQLRWPSLLAGLEPFLPPLRSEVSP